MTSMNADEYRLYHPVTIDGVAVPTIHILNVGRDCLKLYGFSHQIKKLIEECGELAAIASKYENDGCDYSMVLSEAADVQFMLWQLQLGSESIGAELAQKVSRQAARNEKFREEKL